MTILSYEMFLPPWVIPSLSFEMKKRAKIIFTVYHLGWCGMILYCVTVEGSEWSAWISVVVMVGFTVAGAVALLPKGEAMVVEGN